MKLMKNEWLRGAVAQLRVNSTIVAMVLLLGLALVQSSSAQAISTTTVQGTVYLANGQAGSGTLHVSWPAFTTANGQAVAADSLTLQIAPDGFVSVKLAPNMGAIPAGLFYTAVFYMSDGTASTQYWVVPSAAQASLSDVQSQLMPAAQAVKAVSKAYVDQQISQLSQSLLTASGGTLSGPLYLNGDPTQALQAATKHYVDMVGSKAVPLTGGNMTGALGTPAVNGVQAPAAGSSQTTLQSAINAAGTNGAMEIPPTYAGTDGFTNPSGVRVTDLRASGAQQAERSVKEFGAVCDGTTDDTNALQAALNYAQAHGVALTIPQGVCKTRTLNWHGESIGGMGKQVSALMGFPGQDVLASVQDSPSLLQNTRLHDLTIYVDQSVDVSCTQAAGRVRAGTCSVNRLLESNSIFSHGANGLTGIAGTGAGWAVGNCAISMPAVNGTGGNGLRVAEIENVVIAATGVDPMAAQYPSIHSTHTCGMYLAQWPRWSEFRNIDIRGVNTGIAIPALPGTVPNGLNADSNRWENVTIQATHGFTAAAGSNDVLDNVVMLAGNSSAAGEPPTGLVLNLSGSQQGWTVRNAVVVPSWDIVQPQFVLTTAGGAITGAQVGSEHGLGFDPYGIQVPLKFSGSCTAAATASVNPDGSIGIINVNQGGTGCSATTAAVVNVAGNWDTAAPVNLVGGQSMSFFAGNLLKGNGGYSVWNATGSSSYGTQINGGGGTLPGGGSYAALISSTGMGTTYQVDQFAGVDLGAKLQGCLNTVNATYGGTCDARNFTGNQSMGSNLTISTGNTTVLLPCATITTANQIVVTAGTRNATLRGCALRGGSPGSGSQGGTVFAYSGAGAMVQVGDPAYAIDTQGFHMDDVVINTTAATSATAKGLVAYRTQEMDLESLYFLGNGNQTGMTLDGTGNYTGGTFFDNAFNGFQTAISAVGHQAANGATTDWMNASTFLRLHINCPTSGGNPIAGTYGINLQQGDGNTFTGGDVEGCATALHLGANAQNNTIVGLRNENSTSQVVADAGSAYNNWMTGGTMFTGKLTDNGTRNSFLDSFHRSFNGMNGDWYGSQQDATVTNHYRLGTAAGNERGLLDRYQTDYGYRWTMGLSDATAGEQFYQVLDELNNVYRLSIGQYNNGQASTNNQTVFNSAGTGAVILNGSNNSGTGGVVIGSGGANAIAVATINNAGNAQFNGTLQVNGTSTFSGTPSIKNQADAEVDQVLWAGSTTSQKESLTYKDWNGASQWYAMKDASNNWALNSALGGLDSFKAYQSSNSGDTYINASNASGVVRVNYENGAGGAFKVYGGNSSSLYASFAGATAIQFPGLAASSGSNCLQVDNSGYLSNTGSPCGSSSGGSGTISSANSGQIAYYTGNGTTVGGMSTVPVSAGGTGAATATAALQSLGGISATSTTAQSMAGPLNANVNGVYVVTSYGAVGDCNASGSTAACTNNHDAIQAAIDAAYATRGSVYFPTRVGTNGQTVYYTATPINPKGVSMSGPAGGSGPFQTWSFDYPVVIRGAPSQDVFHVVDIADSGYVQPRDSFTVQDLTVFVDGSVDASSSFPYRRPGRTCKDVSMTGSSAVANSTTQCEFQPGDVGQQVTVAGAGASGATLTTTVASWQSRTQVTLTAAASTPVTNATMYVSVMNLATTQNIGNCAFAYDDRTGAFAAGPPAKAVFRNFSVMTNNGIASPTTCGFFFQGNESPTWDRWEDVNVGGPTGFAFAFVPVSAAAPSTAVYTGIADLDVFNHIYIDASYPFLVYSGELHEIRDMQIFSATGTGPQFLDAYGTVSQTSNLRIDIPEQEAAGACGTTPSAFRLSGTNNHVYHLSPGTCPGGVFQWDAHSSSVDNLTLSAIGMTVNITGSNSQFNMPDGADNFANFVTLNVTGAGNTYTTGTVWNPFGPQPARRQFAYPGVAPFGSNPFGSPLLSRGAISLNRTSDFIDKGAAAYYFNSEDLWFWPNELFGAIVGSIPTIGADSTSPTGQKMKVPAAGGQYLSASNGTEWYVGSQIPAGKMRIYVSAKAASATNMTLQAQVNDGTVTVGTGTVLVSSPTYALYSIDADTTGYSGGKFLIGISAASTDIYVAWVAIRPWTSDLPTGSIQLADGTAITGNHGTGTSLQHSDGSGTSGVCFFSSDGSCTSAAGALQNGTTATTQTPGDNSTKVATTAYVASAIPSSLPPSGSASGDLSGSYPGPTVAKINGAAVPLSKIRLASDASGHIVAAANTLGCVDGYDHLPCIVYAQPNIPETSASGSYVTAWTSTSAGTYRVSGYIYGTTASSTAYSVSSYVKATQTGQSSGNGYLVAGAQIGTSISSGNEYSNVFPLSAGTAVQTESLTSSGTNTGGAWSRGIIIERLQ